MYIITPWFLCLLMLLVVICVFNLNICLSFPLVINFSLPLSPAWCWLVEVIYKNVSLCIIWLWWRCTWGRDVAPVHLGPCSWIYFFLCHKWLFFHLHFSSHVKLFSTHVTLILHVKKHIFRIFIRQRIILHPSPQHVTVNNATNPSANTNAVSLFRLGFGFTFYL